MGKMVLSAYISHGAPTSLVEHTAIHEVYERMGKVLTERGVDTVVVSSPHYFTRGKFEVESREAIPCIQDFYGFPDELYKYSYEAMNNSELVSNILTASAEKNVDVTSSQSWGLDHGAWLPLYFMFPKRNVKVVPVSINSSGPQEHFNFGEAIRAAIGKTNGTFAVFGTGSPVHRLDLARFGYYGDEKFEPGAQFDDKLIEAIATRDIDKVMRIREDFPALFHAAAPEGMLNPLYIALGASDRTALAGKTLIHEFMYYGVSLVATILSAESEPVEALLDINEAKAGIGTRN